MDVRENNQKIPRAFPISDRLKRLNNGIRKNELMYPLLDDSQLQLSCLVEVEPETAPKDDSTLDQAKMVPLMHIRATTNRQSS